MTRRSRAAGFSLIELMIVVVIMGSLVRIAVPAMRAFTIQARAVEVDRAALMLRDATYQYYADTGKWPSSSAWGVTPKVLIPYLPAKFKAKTSNWQIYLNCKGTSASAGTGQYSYCYIGVKTTDMRLTKALFYSIAKRSSYYNSMSGFYVYWYFQYEVGRDAS